MIVGVFLRYFKTYQGINYIPITDEDSFCGLIGANGVGKSSVLEALDCFFNSKEWNLHFATKKSGTESTSPYIVPVFLIKRKKFTSTSALGYIKTLSDVAISIKEADVALSNKTHIKKFVEHRNRILNNIDITEHFLLPIGRNYNNQISISVFNCSLLVSKLLQSDEVVEGEKKLKDDELSDKFDLTLEEIKGLIKYIYIPREINPENFTKLETNEIQELMGETLIEIISERVTLKQISEINKRLNDFLNTLSTELENYSYRTPTDRQQNIKKQDVYNLIIQAFFNIRKLHKKQGDTWLEISSLSSGEKQKAIIDIAHSFLSKHRKNGSNLIIAVDEPESSLHMSACFDQFAALWEISRDCMQVLFSSHWYGFLPTIENGSATVISKDTGSHLFDQINLSFYREQVKQMTAKSKGKFPFDIRLKSINDFVQSLIVSSIGDNSYNWIICEGSSEKEYFSKYFEDLIADKRLRIVPVGGAKEIKRLYSYLATVYEDFKNEITGKIILISDTDPELVSYEVGDFDKLICKRIVNCPSKKKTRLVQMHSNPVSPATEIELALNGKLFHKTLLSFRDDHADILSFLSETSDDISQDVSSYYALDLKNSEWEKINSFFDMDNNKYRFAKRYVEGISEEYTTPDWIQEIKGWVE